VTAIGWIALIVVSAPVGASIARLTGGHTITAQLLQVALSVAILVFVQSSARFRPMRLFVGITLGWALGYLAVSVIYSTPVWLDYQRHAPAYQWVMVDSLVQAIPMALMLGMAMAVGMRRSQLYLVKGDLHARSSMGLFGHRSWRVLIIPLAIVLAAISLSFLLFRLRSQTLTTSAVTSALPILILFPVLNAINEEIRFRNVFLAAGLPLFGPTSILLMTSVFFGLAHFGSFLGTSGAGGTTASGLVYAGGAALIGWILGRATLDTGGMVAAWIIHGASDLVLILGYVLLR